MYKKNSPWVKTRIVDNTILDIQNPRYLFRDPMDEEYVIEQRYHLRPDLYSYYKYGTSKYWWIFAQRNPNELIDPINDFVVGKKIKVPTKKNIDIMG